MKKIIQIGGGLAVVLGAACVIFTLYTSFTGAGTPYYTQIDGSHMEPTESDGGVIHFESSLPYTYTLPAYDANGRERELSFGASRELTQGAYIRLEVVPLRGVVRWEEVSYEDMPLAVQNRYLQ